MTPIGGGESSRRPYTGTKALMVAVLDNGIASYFSHTPRIRAEAELWLADSGHESPFSFTVVCETLGLEPDAVRAALDRVRTQNGSGARIMGRRRGNVRREGRIVASKGF
jgi:hypothetical protein